MKIIIKIDDKVVYTETLNRKECKEEYVEAYNNWTMDSVIGIGYTTKVINIINKIGDYIVQESKLWRKNQN